jgi:hypothetical protein
VPRQRVETSRPVLPRVLYSTMSPLAESVGGH